MLLSETGPSSCCFSSLCPFSPPLMAGDVAGRLVARDASFFYLVVLGCRQDALNSLKVFYLKILTYAFRVY